MAIVRGDEERKFLDEVLGQLKQSPWRWAAAALTPALLWLSVSFADWWALSWIALIPLCFAVTGAGWLAAALIGAVGFAAGGFAQCWWMSPMPTGGMIALGLLAGLACGAMEGPILLRVPLPLRPLVFGALMAGVFALVAVPAAMPGEALLNSAFVRVLFRHIELAVMAGLLALLGRLASELYTGKGEGERRLGGWVGLLAAGLMVLGAAIDGLGVKLSPVEKPEGGRQLILVTGTNEPDKTTRETLGALGRGSVAVWPGIEFADRAKADDLLARAEVLARDRGLLIVATVADDKNWRAAVFDKGEKPRIEEWGKDASVPSRIENFQTSAGTALVATTWERATTSEEEIVFVSHPQAVRGNAELFELRQMQRRALLEGAPQVHAWPGGGAVIDPNARLLERSRGGRISTRMPPRAEGIERLSQPKLRWLHDLFKYLMPLTVIGVLIGEVVTISVRLQRRRKIEQEAALPPVAPNPTRPRRRS